MVSIFDVAALLLTLSALFGWLNSRFIRFPHSIGLLVMGLAASLLLVLVQAILPDQRVYRELMDGLRQINFTAVVMNGMLAFLLFAGALNVNLQVLRDRAPAVAFLAFVGTVISTVVVGLAFWAVAGAIGVRVSLEWALVFGALISPTDPVAVLTVFKSLRLPEGLQAEMEGEALFNDGVAIVLFTFLVGLAAGTDNREFDLGRALLDLLREAGGGLLLGGVTGYIAYRAMRAIDDFIVEVLITLALVAGTYALAETIAVSGPLSVVAAGLLIGELGPRYAMSDRTEGYVSSLWTLIDEVLNSVLFLLIGLEVVVLRFDVGPLVLAVASIPVVLLARLIAISPPLVLVRWTEKLSLRNVPFITWAGVRGGISVALALALPNVEAKPVILTATYAIVLFTIIVQGSTLGLVARATIQKPKSGIRSN